jgi:hypothetical protein
MVLDPWFVTGFAEGEGSFTFSRSGPRLALYFAIKLTRADRPLLVAVQEFFSGVGKIYDVGPRGPSPTAGLTKAASYYRVCRRDDLARVVAHFDEYPLRGAKASSYRIWREMVELRRQPARLIRPDLDGLARALSAAAPRKAPWSSSGLQGSGTGNRAPRPRRRLTDPEEP